MNELIRETTSICPICLKKLSAKIIKQGSDYYIEKTCSAHGYFSTIIWRGENPSFERWGYSIPPESQDNLPDCPHECGLCSGHLQKTCCALIEITGRCNLNCPICFAESGGCPPDPTVAKLRTIFNELVEKGNTFIHLSGGEPTVRDDLPEIVAAAREAGCESIQLNSNGIRLGQDESYVRALADAGLSFVFMQFDGTEDQIYQTLRGKPLFDIKQAAIKNCSMNLVGVTLVPTIVPGVNDHNIGELIRFGVANSPAVRGVHFQPVSYFGRYPTTPRNEDRITLPEILREIEAQTNSMLRITDFAPSCCDHPRCGFHGDFVVLPNTIMALTPKAKSCSCEKPKIKAHLKNRNFVARRWKRVSSANDETASVNPDYKDMHTFLKRVKSHGFTITSMAFQDSYNLDFERLRRCSLHVYDDGKIIPFCARYMTAAH